MNTPFPGMDPYLEHPALWPDVHNRLIAALADVMTPLVAPAYYVALERRAYLLKGDDIVLIGRPDLSVVKERTGGYGAQREPAVAGVLAVEVPMADRVEESFLQIHEVRSGDLVTLVELLSPANKLHPEGRRQYEEKRDQTFSTRTNLVEIDLLRDGAPMLVVGRTQPSDYSILVSRGWERPKAQLYTFGLRDPIPSVPLPLRRGEAEPLVDINTTLHALYNRARFDLRLDYMIPPVPPLDVADAEWAAELIDSAEGSHK